MTYEMAENWVSRGLAVLIEKDDKHIVIETCGEPLKRGEAAVVVRHTVWRIGVK